MCRFALYLGPPITLGSLLTEPSNSIIHQSFHSHERIEPLNGDGFGVAWYVPELSDDAAVFRSVSPAWNDPNLRCLARTSRSSCMLAHVRAATQGFAVSIANTHPFISGPYAFMHNGNVAQFGKIRRDLLRGLSDERFAGVQGVTDSEHIFAMLLDRLPEATGRVGTEALAEALERTVHDVVELSERAGCEGPILLNLALSDGRRAVVTRYIKGDPDQANTLYFHQGQQYTCRDGVCEMVAPDRAGPAVLVCSEPLSDDPGWTPVSPNHMVLVDRERKVTLQEMAA